ncbi:DUF732 domain-containing protein [Actinomadura sp. K4S16]|uniref:DUF732 domain-containing protein n=1 Tax=Actinomadura sp. K4S16 TaxID=1316147 RepID=UPI0011ECAA48|nr:DUF732 domain-containing protein [Actinomadura sp. K4S16]
MTGLMRGTQDRSRSYASRALRQHGRHRSESRPRWGLFSRFSAAASVMLIALGGVTVWQGDRPERVRLDVAPAADAPVVRYVAEVRSQGGAAGELPNGELLGAGEAVCSGLASATGSSGVAARRGLTEHDMRVVARAAVTHLCPEKRGQLRGGTAVAPG